MKGHCGVLFRNMRDDFDDLKWEDHEMHTLAVGQSRFKWWTWHFCTNGHKQGIRSPLLHMNKTFAAAKKRYVVVKWSQRFKHTPKRNVMSILKPSTRRLTHQGRWFFSQGATDVGELFFAAGSDKN